MLIRQTHAVFSQMLGAFPQIAHGYSTRAAGDMRESRNQKKFLQVLSLSHMPLVQAGQVHGSNVHIVRTKSDGKIPGVDAIVTDLPDVALGIIVADCVPILLADVKRGVIAAVHAGWRGTLGNVSVHAVEAMKQLGSDTKDIYASVGPHIGMCCYTVDSARVELFRNAFGIDEKMETMWENTHHLDLGWINVRQLRESGISPDHIEAPAVCTACQSDIFYSFRLDTKETFGEILAVLARV